jgi:hypothetical protein
MTESITITIVAKLNLNHLDVLFATKEAWQSAQA